MLVYIMLKPGFVTKENIVNLRENYLIPEKRFSVLCDGFIRYSKKDALHHYENLKKKPFYRTYGEYISSEDVYATVVEFDGTEKEWKTYRKQVIGATKEKDLVPESFRYQATIAKGIPYVVGKNAIHSSDAYESATSEICIFINLMRDAAKYHALMGNNEVSEDIISKINLFRLDARVREGLYAIVKDYEKTSDTKLSDEDSQEVKNNLEQLKTVSDCAEKAYKNLKKVYEKVKYRYQKEL